MLRTVISSLVLLALPLAVVRAADKDKDNGKDVKSSHATIGKIDSQNDTWTVKTMDENGKEQAKTLHLSNDIKYLNAAGKDAKADSFKSGDDVCVMEKNGKVTEVRKEAEAKITKVDRQAGTIEVKMTDENGKQIDKTFRLTEFSEYIDSTGRVAVLDVFQSGDDVLLVDTEGRIKSMKKAGHNHAKTGAQANAGKKTKTK